jgi:3-oxoacyl-[acyl-carrier-protein] synthase II
MYTTNGSEETMTEVRIAVTGLGATTPVGNNLGVTWKNLIAGRSGVARITAFDPSNLGTQIAAQVKEFDPKDHFDAKEARRLERFVQFATMAAREAIADAHFEINAQNCEKLRL